MKTRIFAMTATALVASALTIHVAAWNSEKYCVSDMRVARENGQLKVSMTVDPKDYRLSINKKVEIIPVVRSKVSADSIVLPAVAVAGRNSYWYTVRDDKAGDALLRSGSKDSFSYSYSTDWQPWMDYSDVTFRTHVSGCCGSALGGDEDLPVASIDFIVEPFNPTFRYAQPLESGVKMRKLEGKAYVSFPVNRTEIYPEYMNNPVELRKITAGIDTVRNDADASVKSITLTGFASPEGPYSNNVRLASGRTDAVKEYVRKQYTFPASVFRTNYVPEDWAGLRDSIAASSLPDRDAMLDFIDNGGIPIERRNDEFRKRFPRQYQILLKNVYPWLRHTNYLIDYEIREYVEIEDILRIYKENPSKLSLGEFYRAANTHPVGSKEYNEVIETALAFNKDNAEANINAANVSMAEGDYKRASILLSRVPESGDATYALAVLGALEGKLDAAEAGFEKAKAAGITEADEALSQIALLRKHNTGITYAADQK